MNLFKFLIIFFCFTLNLNQKPYTREAAWLRKITNYEVSPRNNENEVPDNPEDMIEFLKMLDFFEDYGEVLDLKKQAKP